MHIDKQTKLDLSVPQGYTCKLKEFQDNKLETIDLLDMEKFSRILQLDSMKELIQSRQIVFDDSIQNCCDILNNIIHINPRYSLEDCLKFTIYKLRKHQLNSRYDRFKLSVEEAVVYNRSVEADCFVYLIRVLWEIKLSLIDREMFYTFKESHKSLKDCFDTYEKEVSSNWTSLYNTKAFFDTFVAWFYVEDDHMKSIDTATTQYALSDYANTISRSDYTLLFMSKIFIIKGKTYITKQFIDDKEAIFTEVRDRSNANFLWFIKFERAFSEAESEIEYNVVDSPPDCIIINFNDYKTRRSSNERC